MRQFKDNAGRTWTVDINVATLKRQFTFDTTLDPATGGTTDTPPQPDRSPRTDRPADRRPYPTTR